MNLVTWLETHLTCVQSYSIDGQAKLQRLSRELRREWRVLVRHVERVKLYAPHIRHLVLDVDCRPDQASAQHFLSSESPVMTAPCMDDGAVEKLTAPPPKELSAPQGLYLSPGVLFAYSNNPLGFWALERTASEGL